MASKHARENKKRIEEIRRAYASQTKPKLTKDQKEVQHEKR